MDGLIGLAGVLGLLLAAGATIGAAGPSRFAPGWLLAAAALVALNDAMLTNVYGVLRDVVPGANWNWQGKALALTATLAVASLPGFGWRACGLTLAQAPGSLRWAVPVALLYVAFFAGLAWMLPDEAASAETIAFQLTAPGLEEEAFYRGILLLVLGRAFSGRLRFAGVDWHWGALLSSALFGLSHAFGWSDGGFAFDPLTMALTAVPSLLGVWLTLRTGSVLLPVLLHNFGNAVTLLI